jgi:hypothetical protein
MWHWRRSLSWGVWVSVRYLSSPLASHRPVLYSSLVLSQYPLPSSLICSKICARATRPLLYGCFVLPESLPKSDRQAFSWRAANPINSLRALAQLKGVGPLVGVVAFSGLAQFVLYTSWVL